MAMRAVESAFRAARVRVLWAFRQVGALAAAGPRGRSDRV